MHEAAIAQSILKIANAKLNQIAHAEAVLNVRVLIGEFRNVDIDSLKFAFDSLKTSYEGLKICNLEAEFVEARAFCCGDKHHKYHPDFNHSFRCTECNSGIDNLICGEELDVINMVFQTTMNEGSKESARIGR